MYKMNLSNYVIHSPIYFNKKYFIFSNPFSIRFSQFHATGLFLYPLKTEHFWFSDVFGGYEKTLVAWNVLVFTLFNFLFRLITDSSNEYEYETSSNQFQMDFDTDM